MSQWTLRDVAILIMGELIHVTTLLCGAITLRQCNITVAPMPPLSNSICYLKNELKKYRERDRFDVFKSVLT